jgi:hypothetical protein
MFHTGRNADITQQPPIVTVPISTHDATNEVEIQKLEVATFPVSEEKGGRKQFFRVWNFTSLGLLFSKYLAILAKSLPNKIPAKFHLLRKFP